MADTSDYTIEERLVAAVWVHERQINGKSMKNVMDDFVARFVKGAPTKKTLLAWEKKTFLTGSVRDAPRSGRPSTRLQLCADVESSIHQSPVKSTRKRAAELGIPESTMRKHIKVDLKMKCWRPLNVNELSDDDMNSRVDACGQMLQRFHTMAQKAKVMFTDECAIYRSSRSRNVYFWGKENPHFFQEIERNPPHVMVWAGMTQTHLFGPYFFDGSVNQDSYLHMINDWLIPQLRNARIQNNVWFQQDGAPAHFALAVRQRLTAVFGNRWIGRGSVNHPAPLPWPPRSPDLTTPDNALWGYIKEKVRRQRYVTTDDLQNAVRVAFQTVTPEMLHQMSTRTWRRIQLCSDHGGTHTDVFDS